MRAIITALIFGSLLMAQTTTKTPAKSTTSKAKSSGTAKSAPKAAPAGATHTAARATSAKWEHPVAVFDTSMGKINCELFQDKAPKTVANFIGLAKGTKEWKHPFTGEVMNGKPLYDGVTFHRVIPNFMIQGGDPQGNGSGDIGYKFADEFSPDLKFDRPGRMAMANAGPNTNSSQFFITEVPNQYLDPCLDEQGCVRGGRMVPKGYGYTIFGQCDPQSLQVVAKIARVATDPRNNKPYDPVTIKHITILGDGAPAKGAGASSSKASTPAPSKSKTGTGKAKSKSKSTPAAQQPK
jgi:peptidyl-prolyl cis-trans isomerase A (cyclophilin A)